jgi:Holliday junction resolvase RusA-like endonuclease
LGVAVRSISFIVYGTPGPQGSKTNYGRGRTVESSAKVKPWREAVKAAAREAMGDQWQMLTGPVWLTLYVGYSRPASHFGTGRNGGRIKPSAPRDKATAPDLSKIIRSTEDALTEAGIWRDDRLVISVCASKFWTLGPTRAFIIIETAPVHA